jgi:hypothetical protein
MSACWPGQNRELGRQKPRKRRDGDVSAGIEAQSPWNTAGRDIRQQISHRFASRAQDLARGVDNRLAELLSQTRSRGQRRFGLVGVRNQVEYDMDVPDRGAIGLARTEKRQRIDVVGRILEEVLDRCVGVKGCVERQQAKIRWALDRLPPHQRPDLRGCRVRGLCCIDVPHRLLDAADPVAFVGIVWVQRDRLFEMPDRGIHLVQRKADLAELIVNLAGMRPFREQFLQQRLGHRTLLGRHQSLDEPSAHLPKRWRQLQGLKVKRNGVLCPVCP